MRAGFDSRSLRLFYLLLGGLCVIDAWQKSLSYWIAYAPGGVYPEEFASQYALQRLVLPYLSKFFSADWPAIALALYAMAALFSAVFRNRRLWALLAYILLAAIHLRSPDPLFGFDRFLIAVLFASLFMPDLSKMSLHDGAQDPRLRQRFPFLVYLVQWSCIYIFTGLWKDGPAWRSDFSAVERSLWISSVAKDSWLSQFLLSAPTVSQMLTAGVTVLEILGPFLVFFGSAKVRNFVAASIVCMHVGFYFCFDIGLFSYIGLIAAIPLFSDPRIIREVKSGSDTLSSTITSWRSAFFQGLVLFFCFYIPVLNIISFHRFRESSFFHPSMDRLNVIGNFMGIPQKWAMFAPEPSKVDEFFLLIGFDESTLSSPEKEALTSILRTYSKREDREILLTQALAKLCQHKVDLGEKSLVFVRRFREYPDLEFRDEELYRVNCL